MKKYESENWHEHSPRLRIEPSILDLYSFLFFTYLSTPQPLDHRIVSALIAHLSETFFFVNNLIGQVVNASGIWRYWVRFPVRVAFSSSFSKLIFFLIQFYVGNVNQITVNVTDLINLQYLLAKRVVSRKYCNAVRWQ